MIKDKWTKKLTTLAIAIGASTLAEAKPIIENINFNAGTDASISGEGFGPGPNIVLYDDFEAAEIANGKLELNPKIGEWYQVSSSNPVIYADQEINQSLFVRGKGDASLNFGVKSIDGPYGLKPFTEIYFSYSVRDLGDFPGTGGTESSFSTVSSTKDAWMMFGARGDNLAYSASQGQPAGHDLYIPAWTGNGFNIAGNTTKLSPTFWQHELTKNWAFLNWNTTFFHGKINNNDPYGAADGFFGFVNVNKFHINERIGNLIQDNSSEGLTHAYWDRIKFFAWMNEGDADVERILDNIYIAIGPNANARVIVTNAPTLEKSSKLIHLPVNEWGQEKISVEIPKYILESKNETHYIFVIDSRNQQSDPVKICNDCPVAPKLELIN
ncbi:hypothetical protein MARI_13110 [Marinobacter sp. JH2]|nr:hypothetical protein [Marinobacter sp. JH2]QBM17205.1 hypothetical protein MARI_13110 [Marinobacter sp. JH2]